MNSGQLHVVVTIEPHLLSSSIQQFLSRNPRLNVEAGPAHSDVLAEPFARPDGQTVHVELLEDPFRFELHRDGYRQTVDYRGLDDLAELLSDLAQRETSWS